MKLGVLMELVDRVTSPARRIAQSAKRLNADLGFDRITASARRVGTTMRGVASEASRMATRIAAAAGVAGGALLALTMRAAKAGDSAARAAQVTGMSSREWQRTAYAMEVNGIAAEELQSGLFDLNKRTVEAVRGNEDAQKAFKNLGVDILDSQGKVKSTSVLLAEISDRFAAMPDDARKAEAADKLFAGAAQKLIPILNQGSAALREFGDEAERSGRVLSEDALRQSQNFMRGMARLRSTLDGIIVVIGSQLLPVINPLIERLQAWIVANQELIQVKVVEFIARLPGYIETLIQVVDRAAAAMAPLIAAFEFVSGLIGPANTLLLAMSVIFGGRLLVSVIRATLAIGGLAKAVAVTAVSFARLAIGGVVAAFGNLFTALRAGYGVMAAFNLVLAANPIGVVVMACAALAAAAYAIWRNWDTLVAFFGPAFTHLQDVFAELPKALLAPLAAVQRMLSGLVDFVVGVFTLDLERAFNGLKEFFAGWGDWFEALFAPILGTINLLSTAAKGAGRLLGFGGDDAPAPADAHGATGAASVPVHARNEVGGELHIRIDAEGQPRVKKAAAANPRVPLSVDTGKVMP